jgi:hypothetical protein
MECHSPLFDPASRIAGHERAQERRPGPDRNGRSHPAGVTQLAGAARKPPHGENGQPGPPGPGWRGALVYEQAHVADYKAGRIDDVKREAAEIRRFMPRFSIESLIAHQQYRNMKDNERLVEAMKQSGPS